MLLQSCVANCRRKKRSSSSFRTHAHRFNDAFTHGLGMLIAETNVPVVPCGLIGSFEALPPNRKIPRPVTIKLIIGEALNFAAIPNTREGWSQIPRNLNRGPRAGCTINNLRFRVSLELLCQIRRNVRDDRSVVCFVSQFEHVTYPMDLRDQRTFVCGNPKPRAQSP
jgi:hypothetical protein